MLGSDSYSDFILTAASRALEKLGPNEVACPRDIAPNTTAENVLEKSGTSS